MKLRFRVGRKEASKQGRKNGDIEALADAMRALKNCNLHMKVANWLFVFVSRKLVWNKFFLCEKTMTISAKIKYSF